MNFNNLALFRMAQTRMDFVAQRQKTLAQNIANVDTPGYRAREVREPDFQSLAQQATERQTQTAMAVTRPGHIRNDLPDPGPFREDTVRRTFETTISGNNVILEEQVEQLSRGRSQYDLALTLLRKNTQMIKRALGANSG